METIYTATEAAKYLGISVKLTWELLASGEIKGVKMSKSWRITQSALDEFLQARQGG